MQSATPTTRVRHSAKTYNHHRSPLNITEIDEDEDAEPGKIEITIKLVNLFEVQQV